MNRKWITAPAIAAAGIALVLMGAGAAHAAPGEGGCLRPLVEAGTITQEQADEVHAAKKALKDAGATGRDAHAQALAGLVANGTLTQAQADTIESSRRAGNGKPAGAKAGKTGTASSSSAGAPSSTTYAQ